MESTGHLVRLAPGWSLWRTAALRSAGLPFDLLKAFAPPPAVPRAASQVRDAVGQLLREPSFLEALTWQNPAMVSNWVGRHAAALRQGVTLPRSTKREAAIARYAQRYCAKNDTIGFFGPVAWATLTDRASDLTQSGAGGLRRRAVYFETWAIQALADRWRDDKEVFPHLPLRLRPAVFFDGRRLHRPWRAPEEPSDPARAVLAAASRAATVGDATRAVAEHCGAAIADAYTQIEQLRAQRVLDVGFVVPLDEQPDHALHEQLGTIPDADVRARLRDQLDAVRRMADTVSCAAGDPPRLHRALEDLAHGFTALTGEPGRRTKHTSATGRGCVYEDCRRDLDVEIGTDLLDGLRTPLRILLDSARWLAASMASAVEDELRVRYRELSRRSSEVRLAELYFSAADILSGSPGTAVDDVTRDFQLRWAELLGASDVQLLRIPGTEAATLSAALFPGRTVAWSGARYHSPDLLLCRVGERYQWVLGELHVALNTLESRVFHTQSDNRAALDAAIAADMAGGRIVALPPLSSSEVSPRTYPPLASCPRGRYLYWSYGDDAGAPNGERRWPATVLRVHDGGGRLTVEPVDGAWRAPLVEVLGELLTALVVNRFRIRPPAPHAPRVLIDDVVVCREMWRFPAAELAARTRDPATLAAHLAGHGVPRHVFARASAEPKPFYVDLEAPLLVRNLCRAIGLVRQRTGEAGEIEFVEMLPRPEHLWLRDQSGNRFTCELRTVAVDDTSVRVLPDGGW